VDQPGPGLAVAVSPRLLLRWNWPTELQKEIPMASLKRLKDKSGLELPPEHN
jgi:hypothetical protein